MKSNEGLKDLKPAGKAILKQYIIGGYPGDSVIKYSGLPSEVAYYENTIQTIMGWSELTFDDVEEVISSSPDNVRHSPDQTNRKAQYIEALNNLRRKR